MTLLGAAERYLSRPYGHPATRHDASCIDCSTLTAHVLDDTLPGGLSTAAWLDVVLADGSRPWSPIERAVADGWAEAPPNGWDPVWSGDHLLQCWVAIPTDGHAMLGRYSAAAGGWRLLEATNRKHRDGRAYGVRWRGATERAVAPLSWEDALVVPHEVLLHAYPGGVRAARLVGF